MKYFFHQITHGLVTASEKGSDRYWHPCRCGSYYKDAKPIVKPGSNSMISGLSNEALFVSEFNLKDGQNKQNVEFKISCLITYEPNCSHNCKTILLGGL